MVYTVELFATDVKILNMVFFFAFHTEVGKVTLKSNGDEALSDDFLLKSNGDEAFNNVFP